MKIRSRIARYINERESLHIYEGVRICNYAGKEHNGPFVNRVLKALHVLKHKDPRRFRRVLRLGYIVNAVTYSKMALACYIHPLRECWIDNVKFDQLDASYHTPEFFASVLVHEATHCLLCEKFGEVEDHAIRLRLEALCYIEQSRFMKRVGYRFPETFDEAGYRQGYRRSRLEAMAEGLEQLAENGPPGSGRRLARRLGKVLRAIKRSADSGETEDVSAHLDEDDSTKDRSDAYNG